MLSKAQLIKAFNAGHVETCYAEVMRYGAIVTDARWNIPPEECSRYAGSWRSVYANHRGLGWHFTLLNGQISETGLASVPYVTGIHGRPVTEEENERHKRIAVM